jgi:hypothetical protein
MTPLVWLVLAAVAGAGSAAVGLPAWRELRSRGERDLNVERYRAWRGHGSRSGASAARDGMTSSERRRLAVGAALAAVAVIALVAFFVSS